MTDYTDYTIHLEQLCDSQEYQLEQAIKALQMMVNTFGHQVVSGHGEEPYKAAIKCIKDYREKAA